MILDGETGNNIERLDMARRERILKTNSHHLAHTNHQSLASFPLRSSRPLVVDWTSGWINLNQSWSEDCCLIESGDEIGRRLAHLLPSSLMIVQRDFCCKTIMNRTERKSMNELSWPVDDDWPVLYFIRPKNRCFKCSFKIHGQTQKFATSNCRKASKASWLLPHPRRTDR